MFPSANRIDYDPAKTGHTLDGPRAAFGAIFPEAKPRSVLDIGCGPGTWLRVAADAGIADVRGVDGLDLAADELFVAKDIIQVANLERPFDLGRKFELVICLEVAEHLDAAAAPTLIGSLTRHADTVLFSAACPGQPGQHHVNCQWPDYWQQLFNARGFVVEDSVRWKIWNNLRIEAWYRQNMFIARRDDNAGKEPRILGAVEQSLAPMIGHALTADSHLRMLREGCMSPRWYLDLMWNAFIAKLQRTPVLNFRRWARTGAGAA